MREESGRRAPLHPGGSPGLPDVPTFLELYQEIHGTPADSEQARLLTQFVRFVVRMNRTVFLPPGSPGEAVEALRTAFERLATDEQFLADYREAINTDPVIIYEEEGLAAIEELAAPDPVLVAFIEQYVNSAQ